MMKKEEMIAALDALQKDPDAWTHDRDAQTHSASVDEYHISVRWTGSVNEWTVTHDRLAGHPEHVPAELLSHAKRDALAYVRAHILGNLVPQHQH